MRINFFQEGGPVAPQDPVAELIGMAQQAVQANDPNMAMQVCQILVQMAQGGPQEGPQGDQQGAPEPAQQNPQGEPVFKFGGQLKYRF